MGAPATAQSHRWTRSLPKMRKIRFLYFLVFVLLYNKSICYPLSIHPNHLDTKSCAFSSVEPNIPICHSLVCVENAPVLNILNIPKCSNPVPPLKMHPLLRVALYTECLSRMRWISSEIYSIDSILIYTEGLRIWISVATVGLISIGSGCFRLTPFMIIWKRVSCCEQL